MPPFGGQEANRGLVDALHLVEHLTSSQFASLPKAMTAYKATMRAYAAPVQLEALAAAERGTPKWQALQRAWSGRWPPKAVAVSAAGALPVQPHALHPGMKVGLPGGHVL
jgi:2-polyprenyl-6-methoxyphenol hydroxylase-like FAD-dependent oxidoreductase